MTKDLYPVLTAIAAVVTIYLMKIMDLAADQRKREWDSRQKGGLKIQDVAGELIDAAYRTIDDTPLHPIKVEVRAAITKLQMLGAEAQVLDAATAVLAALKDLPNAGTATTAVGELTEFAAAVHRHFAAIT